MLSKNMIRSYWESTIVEIDEVDEVYQGNQKEDFEIYAPDKKKVKLIGAVSTYNVADRVSILSELPLEMIEHILSFVQDESFLSTLQSLLLAGRMYAFHDRTLAIKLVLQGRQYFHCRNTWDLDYICKFLLPFNKALNGKVRKQLEIWDVKSFTSRHFELIEKFHTVEFVNVSFTSKILLNILNRTSLITNILFTNCMMDNQDHELNPSRVLSPHLKRLIFNKSTSVEDWLNNKTFTNLKYIETDSRNENLKALATVVKRIGLNSFDSSTFLRGIVRNQKDETLDYLSLKDLDMFGSIKIPCQTLNVNIINFHLEKCEQNLSNIKNLIIRNKPELSNSENETKPGQDLMTILRCLARFEQVTIPESFFRLKMGELQVVSNSNLKRIQVMISKRNKILMDVFRYRLEQAFPHCSICFKEINNLHIQLPHKQFETLDYNCQLLQAIHQIKRKIEGIRSKVIYLREEKSKYFQSLLDEKLKRLSEILNDSSNDNVTHCNLIILGAEIDEIEGFKSNIEIGLKNMSHSISIYEELIGNDEILSNLKMSYAKTLSSIQVLGKQEEFQRRFKQLDSIFIEMKNSFESHGYNSKLLFKSMWQADDVVEFYTRVEDEMEEWHLEECNYPDDDVDFEAIEDDQD